MAAAKAGKTRLSFAVALIACFLVAGGPAGAQSATAKVRLLQSNWYWRENVGNVGGKGVAPPAAPPDESVPAGDLAVAGPTVTQGPNPGPDKETYLEFDLSSLPPGAQLNTFKITLPVDPAGVTQTGGSAPPVIACAAQDPWVGGPGAEQFAGKPHDDCTHAIPVVSNSAGTEYAFDIAPIARAWVAGASNYGIAITDPASNTTRGYQVVFGPKASIDALTADVEFAVADQRVTPAQASSTFAPAPPSGGPAITFPPPVTTPPAATVEPTTMTSSPPAPEATANTLAAAPVASRSASPFIGFWILFFLVAFVLFLISFVLGDEKE